MMTGEEAELKEQSNTSESREGNSNSERRDSLELARNIHEDDEEERPCSLNSQTAVTKERRSSHSSSPGSGRDTPEPDIESSLAYKSYTKSSRKRSKRYLPPDEPNEVNEWISEEVVSPESPALLRNKLLTAVVNQAEKDRKVIKDSEALESLLVDDLNSSSSSIQIGKFDESLQKKYYDDDTVFVSQNADKNCPVNNGRSASSLEDEKSTKSETSLLGCDNQQISAYKKGPKSAPGPVGVASRCTQTEWSWLEDMKRFDSLRSRLQHSTTPSDNVGG